ncbi:MAG TPA: phosphatase PAP2 family protein [Stellaceae bacterium]|nr:phosphatase PAP2 family protein [Stellaceae bacterium]
MHVRTGASALAILAGFALSATAAQAQSATNLIALQGLAPVSALGNTDAGKAALAANLSITGAIQNGNAQQPTLLPWPQQQQLALRDAFITSHNAYELADGLGTKLGAAYQSLTSYTSSDDGKTAKSSSQVPSVQQLITYAFSATSADAGSGKFFFADATVGGKKPVSAEAAAILSAEKGVPDIFGRAYGLPAAGGQGKDPYDCHKTADHFADPNGDSRPFQTEPVIVPINGPDFFGVTRSNADYLCGPVQDQRKSPSYPSGHTTYSYTESLTLALLVPQRYPQMILRAAEYGNNRIIIGAHYAMDILGGRTLATYDMAQLLANKKGYVGVARKYSAYGEKATVQIDDFPKALAEARADLTKALSKACGGSVVACARQDKSRFASTAKGRRFYEVTQTYGLPVVFPDRAKSKEDVGKLAPEAGLLLTTAFPYLSLKQADKILTQTEGPGGGFLDNGSAFGVYSRLNLYEASMKAMALAPHKVAREKTAKK